ncbi:gastrula zinc finger protein XlCGF7.1-like [Planococcus citri]|uniref:gastrula zinc finger protein XlCGF7.1-like n=1 Tax=Planococcus citri TaxID=170843 RepID=UPI0031F8E205
MGKISDVFVCPNMCGRSYKQKAGLYRHLKYECGCEKQFQCSECFKAFAHILTESFVCSNGCGRQYKYKCGLQQHLNYECGRERQFKCPECPKAFHRKCNWKVHLFTGSLFACPNACGRRYKYKKGLQQHLNYECGREKQFKCTLCPRAFHHKSEYFYCPKRCGRKYKYQQGLKAHLKYECGLEKQFKCVKCGKAFVHKSNLRAHMVNIHSTICPDEIIPRRRRRHHHHHHRQNPL